ncbi:MAG TPA: hypothetical protein VLK65_17335 [Vicinamibacteria bacterium]|nr:hypothetical protein [Vicinamibacteria bacterium]
MRQHVTIVGALYTAFGVIGVFCALAALLFFGGLAGILRMVGEPDATKAAPILVALAVFLFFAISVFSIPGIVVGIGLLKFQKWARVGAILLSALNLLNFPFGTALGAYGLWVLLNEQTESLFA